MPWCQQVNIQRSGAAARSAGRAHTGPIRHVCSGARRTVCDAHCAPALDTEHQCRAVGVLHVKREQLLPHGRVALCVAREGGWLGVRGDVAPGAGTGRDGGPVHQLL